LGDAPTELVITNVVLTSNEENAGGQGPWAGEITGGNSATWTNGAIRYKFPTGYADYDFFEIEYTGGQGGSVVWKQFDNNSDYGYTSLYPNLSATEGAGTFKFEIRGAGTSGGIALQAHSNTTERSITITKITFTKGTRYTVTLNSDGGTGAPATIVVVLDTKLGTFDAPTKDGFNFTGWKLGAGASAVDVDEDTVVTTAFSGATLTAQWTAAAAVVPTITVNFTAGIFRSLPATAGEGPTITVIGGGTGYEYLYGTKNYGSSIAPFSITLASGVSLADYDTIECDFVGLDGDATYKTITVYAATGTTMTVDSNSFAVTAGVSTGNGSLNNTPAHLTFTINKSNANLTGQIEIAFQGSMNNAGNGSNGTNTNTTKYSISNVVLKKNP